MFNTGIQALKTGKNDIDKYYSQLNHISKQLDEY